MNSLGGMTSDEVENRISAFIDIVLIAIIEPK